MKKPTFDEMMEGFRKDITSNCDYSSLPSAFLYCRLYQRPVPDWLYQSLQRLVDEYYNVGHKGGRYANDVQRDHQHLMDELRYAAVKMALERGASWPAVYGIAADLLEHSAAHGSEDTIKKSYQKIRKEMKLG